MNEGMGRDFSNAKPLRFGTSGLRALVTEMTDMECAINTRGFCGFLRATGQAGGDSVVSVGGDLRSSTPRIMAAVARAVRDSGLRVDFCGRVPSPALAQHAMAHGRPSVMVTGSHIPEDRNGIKFTKPSGEVLKSDEAAILKHVALARAAEQALDAESTIFDAAGAFKRAEVLPSAHTKAMDRYLDRYRPAFPADCLAGLKICFYEHSAVGRDVVPAILEGLGAEVVRVHRSTTFVPVDTEKVSEQTRALLAELASAHEPDAIFSTDGDSDRPLVADNNGRFLPGDKLGALASMFLEPDFAAVPISTNSAVVTALQERGIDVASTRIGSPYVIAAMNEHAECHRSARRCAWEANGGFLLGSPWQLGAGTLPALPTRDAVLPFVATLLLARQREQTLSQLIDTALPPRHNTAGVVDDSTAGCESYTAEMGRAIVGAFSPQAAPAIAASFGADGALQSAWDADRHPVEDASTLDAWRQELQAIRSRVADALSPDEGFSAVRVIDFTDGIRVTFADGDVAHLRPSGNAPEFRVYAEADDAKRAAAIVAKKGRILPRIIEGLTLAD